MGWASGCSLCEDICRELKPLIGSQESYEKISAIICKHFVQNDADDWDFSENSPYWNYLKTYEPEEFKEYLEEIGE